MMFLHFVGLCVIEIYDIKSLKNVLQSSLTSVSVKAYVYSNLKCLSDAQRASGTPSLDTFMMSDLGRLCPTFFSIRPS